MLQVCVDRHADLKDLKGLILILIAWDPFRGQVCVDRHADLKDLKGLILICDFDCVRPFQGDKHRINFYSHELSNFSNLVLNSNRKTQIKKYEYIPK